MNNKGQTLVIFIVLLPLMGIIAGYIFDKCYLMQQKEELNNIANIVCQYALDEEKTENDIKQLALENDKNIKNIKINRLDYEVQLTLEKNQKSIFSFLVGKDAYQIKIEASCIEEE